MSYQRASRDWDIRRHAGREVAGGSRARYMDGYSRHSPLPKQQQYLDPGPPQCILGQGSLQEQFPDVQQQFPDHGQRFYGLGALQEQFPGQKYQLQQQIPVSWHGGQQQRRYSDPWQLPSGQPSRPDARLRYSSEAATTRREEEGRLTD